MNNAEVAAVLDEIADLLEIQGQSAFRVRAYRNAARTIGSLGREVAPLAKEGEGALAELPGIGADLAGKIVEIVRTGTHAMIAELTATIPETVVLMMRIPGVGPKRAKLLYDELGLTSIEALAGAARSGKLDAVRGFGPTLQRKILEGTAEYAQRARRHLLAEADAYAEPLIAWMRGARDVLRVEACGSLRRRKETIGDLDVLVASRDPTRVAERFVAYPGVIEVLARGEGRCAVRLKEGVQSDLRIVPPESFGAALHYFTGSKSHNIAIRKLGVRAGLKINEYGVFRGKRRIGGEREEDVFGAVGLPLIPPELREDAGEVEAAREGELPALVTLEDIRGELHLHTADSSLAEMVLACAKRGYAYVAVADRLDRDGLRKQARAIASLRRRVAIEILRGVEVDVRPDGGLALEDDVLAGLDVVVAVARDGALSDAALLRALRDPRVDVLAHPGKGDVGKIARAAADLGVLLEVDARPGPREMSDVHIRVAKEAGALVVVSTDAHHAADLDLMRYAVDQARRGWCTAKDVANARPLAALRRLPARVAS